MISRKFHFILPALLVAVTNSVSDVRKKEQMKKHNEFYYCKTDLGKDSKSRWLDRVLLL